MTDCPHCGCELTPPAGGRPRSVEQIRRYFAMIRAAYHHWPETHEHQFASAEQLRAWLQMKAGARDVGAIIPLTGIAKERAMLLAEAAIGGAGSYAMPVIHGDSLVVFRPRSISFSKMGPAAFSRLSDDVAQVIETETGISAEQLLSEKAA